MSEKDLKIINEIAKTALKSVKTMSKEDARLKLVNAGILNDKGKYTAPYKNLARVTKTH